MDVTDDLSTEAATIATPEGVFRLWTQRMEYVEQDDNPRLLDGNVGVMVLAHKRYILPREGDLADRIHEVLSDSRYGDGVAERVRAVAAWLMIEHGTPVVLPVWGYDHGELRLSADAERRYPFDDRFDSGLAGIIYADPEALAARGLLDSDVDGIAALLAEEVSHYDSYATGDVHQYVVERRVGGSDEDGWQWEEEDRLGVYFSEQEAVRMGLYAVPGAQKWYALDAYISTSDPDLPLDADERRPVRVRAADGRFYQAWHVMSRAVQGEHVGRWLMAVLRHVAADPAANRSEGWVPVDPWSVGTTYATPGEATAAALAWIKANFGMATPAEHAPADSAGKD